jgi:hypothetical protein
MNVGDVAFNYIFIEAIQIFWFLFMALIFFKIHLKVKRTDSLIMMGGILFSVVWSLFYLARLQKTILLSANTEGAEVISLLVWLQNHSILPMIPFFLGCLGYFVFFDKGKK